MEKNVSISSGRMFASDSVSLPRLDNPTGACPTHRRQWADFQVPQGTHTKVLQIVFRDADMTRGVLQTWKDTDHRRCKHRLVKCHVVTQTIPCISIPIPRCDLLIILLVTKGLHIDAAPFSVSVSLQPDHFCSGAVLLCQIFVRVESISLIRLRLVYLALAPPDRTDGHDIKTRTAVTQFLDDTLADHMVRQAGERLRADDVRCSGVDQL